MAATPSFSDVHILQFLPPSGRKIKQQEFTEMVWRAIVSSQEVVKENKHLIMETEHLMKALLERDLARQIFSKVGVDNTRLVIATDKFIQLQPKVLGESAGSMLGRDLEVLIERGRDFMKESGDSVISVEHLVLRFTEDSRFGKELFKDFKVTIDKLKDGVENEPPKGILQAVTGQYSHNVFFPQLPEDGKPGGGK